MLRPTSFGIPVLMFCLVGCALSHRPLMDGGPNTDARIDGSLDARDGDAMTDTPVTPDADGGCPAGTQLCGGSCVSTTAPDHCGSCANDCTTLPGVNPAAVTCAAGACSLTGACAAGRADCDATAPGCETTVNNATNCGACGRTCTGGTPACSDDGTGNFDCTNGCATGQTLCGSTCTDLSSDVMNCSACGSACATRDHATVNCTSSTCSYACISGYHDCGGTCAADNSPASCGSSCAPCTAPSNATATCNSGACGFACNAGFHLCGSQCLPDTDANSCGTSCTPCPAGGGTATCTAGACGIDCGGGRHLCGSGASAMCASDTDPTRCGASCAMCTAAPGGTAVCTGGTCGTSCPSSMHLCATGCASDNDPMRCGASCTMCTTPTNGLAACIGGSCSFTCMPGYVMMGGTCVQRCGNRALDSGETCDDGNNVGGDGCSSTCQMENVIFDSCPSTAAPITVNDRGTHLYTGTTMGVTANGGGNCTANGPDVVWATTVNIAGSFSYRVTLTPTGWNAVMRQDATCPTNTCVMPGTAGGPVIYNGSGTNTVTWNFAADSTDGSSGAFVLNIQVP